MCCVLILTKTNADIFLILFRKKKKMWLCYFSFQTETAGCLWVSPGPRESPCWRWLRTPKANGLLCAISSRVCATAPHAVRCPSTCGLLWALLKPSWGWAFERTHIKYNRLRFWGDSSPSTEILLLLYTVNILVSSADCALEDSQKGRGSCYWTTSCAKT